MLKFAVVGNKGLFGSEVFNLLESSGINVIGFNRSNLKFEELDASQLARILDGFDVVINAVGYTAVDEAETNLEKAFFANATIPQLLAVATSKVGSRLLHISTDYVFDGSGTRPYQTHDPVAPQTAYGRSKALGEQLVFEASSNSIVVRTAWLYGRRGACFPKMVANRLALKSPLFVVDDQVGQPTWTRDLAEQTIQLATRGVGQRLIHSVSSGYCTWAEFAEEVADYLGYDSKKVIERIDSSSYPSIAKRPSWSVLDNTNNGLIPIGDWRSRWRYAASDTLETASGFTR